MVALVSGALAVVDGYLALTVPESAPLVLVFPYASGEWDEAAGTLSYEGAVYRLGDPTQVGGGTVGRDSHRLGDGARSVPPCGVDRLFLVGLATPSLSRRAGHAGPTRGSATARRRRTGTRPATPRPWPRRGPTT